LHDVDKALELAVSEDAVSGDFDFGRPGFRFGFWFGGKDSDRAGEESEDQR
jgi:hypothetical protein